MAHVQIRYGEGVDNDGFGAQIVVDGRDITGHVMAAGFAVEFPADVDGEVVVRMRLAAESIDLDLPSAVIDAIREGADDE